MGWWHLQQLTIYVANFRKSCQTKINTKHSEEWNGVPFFWGYSIPKFRQNQPCQYGMSYGINWTQVASDTNGCADIPADASWLTNLLLIRFPSTNHSMRIFENMPSLFAQASVDISYRLSPEIDFLKCQTTRPVLDPGDCWLKFYRLSRKWFMEIWKHIRIWLCLRFRLVPSPETNSSHLKIGLLPPKGKESSNHQIVRCFVGFREGTYGCFQK